MWDIDRRAFIAGLGGAAAVSVMSHEARADALGDALAAQLEAQNRSAPAATQATQATQTAPAAPATRPDTFPTVADIEAQIPTRHYRRGLGALFFNSRPEGKVDLLPPMPAAPTLVDFFELRFERTRNHCFQSATNAQKRGAPEDVVLACLLHDVVQELIRSDHGYWGAQLFEPYVPERTTFAIKYHQALRFYADSAAGYEYPDLYKRIFGEDYVPAPHVQAAHRFVRNHRWYDAPREVTVNDLYSFDANAVVKIDPFIELIGRNFKQPKEGLGNDDSPVAHMWRTIANPDAPL
jgi:hypothetical protein